MKPKPETRNQKPESEQPEADRRRPEAHRRSAATRRVGGWSGDRRHSAKRLCASLLLVSACAAHRDSREQLSFWALGAEGEKVAAMIPEFERRNPSIHVIVQQIPWTAAHEKLLTAVVGEATPDVAQMGNTWIPEFAAVRALEELRGFGPRDHFAGIWATNVVDGKLYGVPWYVDTRARFYRSDVLACVGSPPSPRTRAQ